MVLFRSLQAKIIGITHCKKSENKYYTTMDKDLWQFHGVQAKWFKGITEENTIPFIYTHLNLIFKF